MNVLKQYRLDVKDGLQAGMPIVIGYVPIAMAFGMLGRTEGITMLESFLFSSVVYAGASQFMALNLLASGIGTWEIVFATLLMNFRQFLMSASVASKLKSCQKKLLPFIAFGVTDESFSVATIKERELSEGYLLVLEGVAYVSWVIGTILGYMAGGIIPEILQNSMGIALYAMFVAILIPAVKKSVSALTLACGAGALHTFLVYIKILPSGWNLIVTILLISGLGVFLFPGEEVNKDE